MRRKPARAASEGGKVITRWMPFWSVLVLFPTALLLLYRPASEPVADVTAEEEEPGVRFSAQLSPYDGIIHKYAAENSIDWRLVAAIIQTESSFRTDAVSSAGASGLMQIMPVVAREQGVEPLHGPEENIRAGVTHLRQNLARLKGETPRDVLQLSLAAYNAGIGHLRDAQNLAMRMKKSSRRWSDVKEMLLLLEKPEFYETATYGYCRGSETAQYVDRVLDQYRLYERSYPVKPVQLTFGKKSSSRTDV